MFFLARLEARHRQPGRLEARTDGAEARGPSRDAHVHAPPCARPSSAPGDPSPQAAHASRRGVHPSSASLYRRRQGAPPCARWAPARAASLHRRRQGVPPPSPGASASATCVYALTRRAYASRQGPCPWPTRDTRPALRHARIRSTGAPLCGSGTRLALSRARIDGRTGALRSRGTRLALRAIRLRGSGRRPCGSGRRLPRSGRRLRRSRQRLPRSGQCLARSGRRPRRSRQRLRGSGWRLPFVRALIGARDGRLAGRGRALRAPAFASTNERRASAPHEPGCSERLPAWPSAARPGSAGSWTCPWRSLVSARRRPASRAAR